METKDASEDQREVTQSLKSTQNQQCVLFCTVNLRNGSVIYQGSKLCGALVNLNQAIAASKALIQKYPDTVGNIDIDSPS